MPPPAKDYQAEAGASAPDGLPSLLDLLGPLADNTASATCPEASRNRGSSDSHPRGVGQNGAPVAYRDRKRRPPEWLYDTTSGSGSTTGNDDSSFSTPISSKGFAFSDDLSERFDSLDGLDGLDSPPDSPLPPHPPLLNPRAAPLSAATVRKRDDSPTFRNEAFSVQASPLAGVGAFAAQDLFHGDVVLREEAVLTAADEDLFDAFAALGERDRRVVLGLHVSDAVKEGTPRQRGVWQTNAFKVRGSVAGLFPIAARFNHACQPLNNVEYRFEPANGTFAGGNRGELVMRVCAGFVPSGSELTISYGHGRSPQNLYYTYGFRCRCGACEGITDEEVNAFQPVW